jgi:lipopolysaccharide biosynthesis glycosyltransferase
MKLFLCTNDKTAETSLIKMLEVSVKSALDNTDFEVFVIFDGDKKKLNLPKEVNIIEHQHRCYDVFKSSKRCENEEHCLSIAATAFLRTEIPFLINQMGFTDEFCLYTDYDVVFQKNDFSELKTLQPKIFAATPESNMNDWSYFNTGVMLMNVNFLFENDDFISNHIRENFERLEVWDQTMYNNLFKNQISRLPIEYNWKPYWGINEKSKIIHFHGIKPFSIQPFEYMNQIETLRFLYNGKSKIYEHYNQLFENYL